MAGCCKDNTADVEEGGCCSRGNSTGKKKRCICLPYDDAFMVSAQVLSIVAVIISWVFWGTFIISLSGFILYQTVWCRRQSRCGLVAAIVICVLAASLNLFSAIFFFMTKKDSKWCEPFTMMSDDNPYDDGYYSYNYCDHIAWSIVSFVGAAFWLAAAGLTAKFLYGGNYAKWEEKLNQRMKKGDTDAVEAEATASATTDGAVATVTATSVAYAAPEVPEKIDETDNA